MHPEREYVRARVPLPESKGSQGQESGSTGTEIVWLVRERAESVLGKDFEELEARPGRELVGLRYEPLFTDEIPFADPGSWEPDPGAIHTVVAGDFVTVEDGTGIVHQAPYGADDWETARAHSMPSSPAPSSG